MHRAVEGILAGRERELTKEGDACVNRIFVREGGCACTSPKEGEETLREEKVGRTEECRGSSSMRAMRYVMEGWLLSYGRRRWRRERGL